MFSFFFFFNDTATTEIYTLSLHDALPIFGTDSAPHARHAKEAPRGCAGIFSAHAGIELYAEAFESAGALERLEAFASCHGADFYGLPRNSATLTLVKEPWQVPESYPFGADELVPLRAGERIARSEEHTSELQSQSNIVCRLLLEKKTCQLYLPRPNRESQAGSPGRSARQARTSSGSFLPRRSWSPPRLAARSAIPAGP